MYYNIIKFQKPPIWQKTANVAKNRHLGGLHGGFGGFSVFFGKFGGYLIFFS